MASQFIIEHVFNLSPVVTGYSSLTSGLSLMAGGIVSKALINKPFKTKVITGISLQVAIAAMMLVTVSYFNSIYLLVGFTIFLHLLSGFIFNNVNGYCLRRFTTNAGTASGLTGGGVYVVSSFLVMAS
ncbi:hypothetical protein [Mucilaginibacter rubeus]|uniref:hypothetical protein n=1 Tax=Mucilaginibacter rubeus TaxID=2027860 RepID=UPI00166CB5FF|nr:hypothetical protein [Mucilaginibacter rubeus]GGA96227.1 hypothetical protein GCM10011500_10030 [Mucilaginibacter rubeus]